ncbi:MAG: NAD(P)H-hydrate dehydratase [Eubacteriales bacterium]
MKVLTVVEMQKLEQYTLEKEGITALDLMETAGHKIFESIIKEKAPDKEKDSIAIVAGFGNNGGDSLVVARDFIQYGYNTEVFMVGNASKITKETHENLKRLKHLGIQVCRLDNDTYERFSDRLLQSTIVVDGIFGIGLNRNIQGIYHEVIERIKDAKVYTISIDIPSGVKGNNGQVAGTAVNSDLTIIVQHYKVGNLINDALDFHGKSVLVDIGMSGYDIGNNNRLLRRDDVASNVKKRKKNSYKYQYGSVLTIGGSTGMTGAPVISAYAALRSGSGLSTIGINEKYLCLMHHIFPEIMVKSYKHVNDLMEIISKKNAISFGPGLGRKDYNHAILESLMDMDIPLIIDADGLYYLKYLMDKVKSKNKIIVTPHFGEMAMLFETTSNTIQEDPLYFVNKLSQEYGLTVVLKGCCTIISQGDKQFFSISGNPGMATAGSGDVLTGIITSLVGQGLDLLQACQLGVVLHSVAGDIATREKGEYSMIATDIISYLPNAFSNLAQQ